MEEKNDFIVLFGYAHHLEKAAAKGIKIYNILLNQKIYDNLLNKDIINIVVNSIEELQNFVEILINTKQIKGIISFTDRHNGVELANSLSQKYDLITGENSVQSIKAFNNKGTTRKILDNHGLKSTPYLVSNDVDEIYNFLSLHKKLILKPIDGEGSQAVSLITSKKELDIYMNKNSNKNIVCEKYIVGKEFSVESITYKGNHFILGITEKFLTNNDTLSPFVESGHLFPARINKKEELLIKEYITKFLDATDIYYGPACSELILTKDGPVLVESQLRPGGDFLPTLIELSTELNMYELTFDLYNSNFEINNIEYLKESYVQFLLPKPGVISSVTYPVEIMEDRDVNRLSIRIKPNDNINNITDTFNRNYGEIIISSFKEDDVLTKGKNYYDVIMDGINYKSCIEHSKDLV
jgi:predicted ATP-grasp superfamily ATP-dependent carboligase